MSYLVLARKYRPRQFAELVGQSHVATTLINAFRQNKLGQAYLLTGTRGVGKTTVARIFAKALRCENPDAQPGGKNPGISCEQCPSCKEINEGSSIDVLEIDGASNNGVDDIRKIRDQVMVMPSRGRMKVFVIDEVHMLTGPAFNALLKTLEEPPPHVTFIFATTEAQKIPSTILSRCQRFDFKRVTLPLICEHLARLASLEGIQAPPAAIRLIGKKADGSMRDALSAMDQCLALGGRELTPEGVSESLGIVSADFLVKLLGHAMQQELLPAAELVNQAFLSGVEMKTLAVGLAETLRNALFVKLRAGAALSDVSDDERAAYEQLVQNLSPEALQAAYRQLSLSLDQILRSPLPKASMEMALARLGGLGRLRSLEELLQRLESPPAQAAAAPTTTPPGPPAARMAAAPAAEPARKIALPVYQIPNPDPLLQPEKKSPEKDPAPGSFPNAAFAGFVRHVLKHKASLGSILEHALASTPDPQWSSAAEVKIGFRKSHAFYQLQAQHKLNFDLLEKLLQEFLHRKVRLVIETVAGPASQDPRLSSIVEKEKQTRVTTAEEKKKRFLEHEIVRDTKEIFGAELSSFDIDKPNE